MWGGGGGRGGVSLIDLAGINPGELKEIQAWIVSRLPRNFAGSCYTSDFTTGSLWWLPCQVPGVIGSVLGLLGLVSVYCDLKRWKVYSATSISAWQHEN